MSWIPRKLVLVPVDFSDNSVQALQTGLQMVGEPADVHALHILPPLDHIAYRFDWGDIDDGSRQDSVSDHFEQFLKTRGISGVTTAVDVGDPGTTIAEYATRKRADLIVISSHGYHGMKRILLGSVAERVIRHADCAVLVLRRGDAE